MEQQTVTKLAATSKSNLKLTLAYKADATSAYVEIRNLRAENHKLKLALIDAQKEIKSLVRETK